MLNIISVRIYLRVNFPRYLCKMTDLLLDVAFGLFLRTRTGIVAHVVDGLVAHKGLHEGGEVVMVGVGHLTQQGEIHGLKSKKGFSV